MKRAFLLSAMRNEAPYLLEWVAYHRLIGFEHFIIVSNDCDDGTDKMLDRLVQLGIVTHIRHDHKGKQTLQWRALRLIEKCDKLKEAEWVLFADCDEFLNIKIGDGTVNALWDTYPKATAFALQWRLFGNNGVYHLKDKCVISQFTRAAPVPLYFPWQASQFKTLFKNDGAFKKLGVHRPQNIDVAQLEAQEWVNSAGRVLPDAFKSKFLPLMGEYSGVDSAQLNHYSVRSAESYLVKSERGLPNRTDRPLDAAYWIERNFNTVEDNSILRHEKSVKGAIEEFFTDDELSDLHHEGFEWHSNRARQITHTLEGIFLLNACLSSETKVLSEERARELMEHRKVIKMLGKG